MAKSDSDSGSLRQDQPELLQINGGFLTGICNGKFQTFRRNSTKASCSLEVYKGRPSVSEPVHPRKRRRCTATQMCVCQIQRKTVSCMGPSLLHHAKTMMRSSRPSTGFTPQTLSCAGKLTVPVKPYKRHVGGNSRRGTTMCSASS